MMAELFIISLLGVALGFAMIWIANRNQAERIEMLEHENEELQWELKRKQ